MLQKIQGHTYYFPGPTNVGVVKYKNGMALLVDAGIDSTAGRSLAKTLDEESLKAKYIILTHAHPDHFGAVKWLKENYTGLIRYANEEEAIWMKHPQLESQMFYGAAPIRELESRFLKGPKIEVDAVIDKGLTEFGDKRYEIIELPGHTFNQIGVLTSDSVLFAGDSLFSEEIMDKYGFPFLLDIEKQLSTIELLSELKAEYVVLSHSPKPYTSISDLCIKNKARIEYYLEFILELCNQPFTREDITEQILTESSMDVDTPQYFMTLATAGAFLSYLSNRKEITQEVIGGKCYFYRE